MIHSFRATNFYSFEDQVEVSFDVDEKAPNTSGYAYSESDSRLSLVEAIIGPNASGKTTALRALTFVQWLLTDSYRHDRPYFPFKQFAVNKNEDRATNMSVTFEVEGDVYTYDLSISRRRLLEERLSVKSKTKERTTHKKLFLRTYNAEADEYVIEDANFGLPKGYTEAAELSNASIIAAASRFGHDKSRMIRDYWKRLESNVNIEDRWIPYGYRAYEALRYYERHEKSRVRTERTLRKFDMGIEKLGKEGEVVHKFKDRKFTLEIDEESSGTQQLLTLLKMIDSTLKNGGLVIIDEFDAYLHPKMFGELVNRFLSPRTNPKHAQLLLSTHSFEILKDLDKQQIILVEKNRKGSSEARRLDSLPGVRADDNFHNKYLSGVYGAIPRITPTKIDKQ